jgi:hypothetical protein
VVWRRLEQTNKEQNSIDCLVSTRPSLETFSESAAAMHLATTAANDWYRRWQRVDSAAGRTSSLICLKMRSRLPAQQAEMAQMCLITPRDGALSPADGLAATGASLEGGTHNFSLIHHSAIFWCEQNCHKSQPYPRSLRDVWACRIAHFLRDGAVERNGSPDVRSSGNVF